jgi:hypothetical protein
MCDTAGKSLKIGPAAGGVIKRQRAKVNPLGNLKADVIRASNDTGET